VAPFGSVAELADALALKAGALNGVMGSSPSAPTRKD
jgi:hypothetical protein